MKAPASCSWFSLKDFGLDLFYQIFICMPPVAGIKIAGRNINNLRYADDTTLMAESEEELKSLLIYLWANTFLVQENEITSGSQRFLLEILLLL